MIGRIPVVSPSPAVDGGRYPAKGYVGEVIPFEVTAFREGHDAIGVELLLTAPGGRRNAVAMIAVEPGTDRWRALAAVDEEGEWEFAFRAYADDYASWCAVAEVKVHAGIDVEIVFAMGAELLTRAAQQDERSARDRTLLERTALTLARAGSSPTRRLASATSEKVAHAFECLPLAGLDSVSEPNRLRVERVRAGVGAWYELFPRSIGATQRADGTWESGTFRSAAHDLPRIAALGFDVVYLPPIHPIGSTFRKGPDNSLTAGPGDPGSPWAIGSPAGGHDAFHPDLGDENDFAWFLRQASANGLEVALDLALQCSPDHPWLREHPDWFTTLPDGSIAYAENPPKKYQDIVPLNFDIDPEGIRVEILRIVLLWVERGVRIFRVDNPHTKPLAFWEWLIARVRQQHPDVVFLAEAFTRPAPLRTLAKAGFQQSYTYFTWRNSKPELEEFLHSISQDTAAYLRPNLFVNTPDILTEYLQFGGVPAFKIRAALAATASPLWGVYSGFELFESVARPGAEEYIDNEKYEYRPRDFEAAVHHGASLEPYLRMLGDARRAHPALLQLRNLRLHVTEDDAVLAYSKHLPARFTGGAPDSVIVVANLDPRSVRETVVHLEPADLERVSEHFTVTDLVTGARWDWGEHNYVRLDAFVEPVHILAVEQHP